MRVPACVSFIVMVLVLMTGYGYGQSRSSSSSNSSNSSSSSDISHCTADLRWANTNGSLIYSKQLQTPVSATILAHVSKGDIHSPGDTAAKAPKDLSLKILQAAHQPSLSEVPVTHHRFR
jgi:hypothetical protein